MTVAVQQPQRRESDLDTILKGLQVVGGIFDIKNQMAKAEALKQEQDMRQSAFQDEKQRQSLADQGIMTPGEYQKGLLAGAYVPSKQEQGGLPVQVGPSIGQAGPANQMFVKTSGQLKSEELAAQKEANAIKEAAAIAEKKKDTSFNRAEKLSSQFRNASKDSYSAITGLKKLEAAAETPNPTGATDVSLVFGFMKSIDPNSTVREGEFATAEQAGGIDDRVLNIYNKLLKGERLTPEQRADFLRAGRESVFKQLEAQKETDNVFSRLAQNGEVDPDLVVDPRFATTYEQLRNKLGMNQNVSQRPAGSVGLPFENTAQGAKNPGESAIDEFLKKR